MHAAYHMYDMLCQLYDAECIDISMDTCVQPNAAAWHVRTSVFVLRASVSRAPQECFAPSICIWTCILGLPHSEPATGQPAGRSACASSELRTGFGRSVLCVLRCQPT